MERKLTHATLDYEVARNILALSRNPRDGNNPFLHDDRNRMSQIVFEFDASRAHRFQYLVNQLKNPNSSMESLVAMQAFMAEFGDSFNIRADHHHHQPPASLFNGHSTAVAATAANTANPAANNSTGDSDISYANSELSAESGAGFIQNMFENNFMDDHGVAMQNYATNHPLYGNRIHKPQPRKAAGNGPAAQTNPNMPHPNGRSASQYFSNQPNFSMPQQQKATAATVAATAAGMAAAAVASATKSRNNPVAHKSNGNVTMPKPRVEPQFLSEEDKAKREVTRERNIKYREKKMVENPFEYRRKKAEAQKRYMEKLKTQNPEGYRRKKVEYQKRYQEKKTKNVSPYFYSL